jgi:hypothetical protein
MPSGVAFIAPWPDIKQPENPAPQLGLERAKEDCKALGLRGRRNHDARRTFISIARVGGARTDILKWVTHGQSQSGGGGESGIMDVYTTFPWSTLCEQVLCVKIDLLEGKVIEMPPAGGGQRASRACGSGGGAAHEHTLEHTRC